MKYEDLLRYENGKLFWLDRDEKSFASKGSYTTWRKRFLGKEAGCLDKKYMVFSLSKKRYLVHRVIWELHYGSIPIGIEIDHINGCETDNRIENLRLSTKAQNQHNQFLRKENTSGVKGVSALYKNGKKRWLAEVCFKLVRVRKTFSNIDEAEEFVRETREKLHGLYANHGLKKC